jgi:hypothetical protein
MFDISSYQNSLSIPYRSLLDADKAFREDQMLPRPTTPDTERRLPR